MMIVMMMVLLCTLLRIPAGDTDSN